MTTFTREDYDMAAKAAGMYGVKHVVPAMRADQMGPDDTPTYHLEGYAPDGRYIFRWNPPEDDGDALRLAATLDMTIRFYGNACAQATRPGGPAVYIAENYVGGDRMIQVRRAIFRAAIAIGRVMP